MYEEPLRRVMTSLYILGSISTLIRECTVGCDVCLPKVECLDASDSPRVIGIVEIQIFHLDILGGQFLDLELLPGRAISIAYRG
jgi:hypothetical protein